MIRQVQRDAPVALAKRLDADPDHLAGCHQRVEHVGLVVGDARRQDLAFEHRGRNGRALQLLDRVEQRFEPAPPGPDAVPRRRRSGRARRVDRLDLLAQPRERPPTEAAQDVRIDPLALDAAGPELAFDQLAGLGEPEQQRFGDCRTQAVTRGQLADRERAVRSRVAQREIAGRIPHRLEQRLRKTRRQRHAERIAIPRDVLDRDEAAFARHGQRHDPPRAFQLADRRRRCRARRSALAVLASVRSPMRISRSCSPSAVRTLYLSSRCWSCRSMAEQRVGIEQLAQLGVAEQLAELRLIDRERLRAPLGQRRVAVVDVVGDVAEEQRGGERRRHLRIDGRHAQRRAKRSSAASRPAPACRSDRAAPRDRFRAGRETTRSATRPRAGPRRACAAATAACACRAAGAAGAGRARPSRGSARRRATSIRAAAAPALRPPRRPAGAARDRAGSRPPGNRTTKPSSPHMTSTSMPVRLRICAVTAIAHGAWMRLPSGDSRQTRQSPSSSRQRSMTIVRSSGTAPAAA